MMIFPHRQTPPTNFHEGAVVQTLFCNSPNGWINDGLFLQWFKLFLAHIPPTQPELLIMDGHETKKHYEKGYDLDDPSHTEWLKLIT